MVVLALIFDLAIFQAACFGPGYREADSTELVGFGFVCVELCTWHLVALKILQLSELYDCFDVCV